jgi:hypothetical protein
MVVLSIGVAQDQTLSLAQSLPTVAAAAALRQLGSQLV